MWNEESQVNFSPLQHKSAGPPYQALLELVLAIFHRKISYTPNELD
jgi:hypothetical protein